MKQVSDDGRTWRDVWTTTTGQEGLDVAVFETTQARYVRINGTQRGSNFGYSIWGVGVHAQ